MDFITVAKLAMRMLGSSALRERVSGIVDTLHEKEEAPTSKYKPGSVEWLQDTLNELNGAGLEVDGEYGERTREAVRQYQGEHSDLEPDGWAGPLTVAALVMDLQRGRTELNNNRA